MVTFSTQGDVLMFQTNDGGEVTFIDGQPIMTKGFETAVYLSLFGGNREDDGSEDNNLQWWGNFIITDPMEKYKSETQYQLLRLPITSASLLKLEEAAKKDLQWLLDDRIASTVEISVSSPELNFVNFNIKIFAEGKEENFNFTLNWKAMQNGT